MLVIYYVISWIIMQIFLLLELTAESKINPSLPTITRIYIASNFKKFRNLISAVSWDFIYVSHNVNLTFSAFYDVINSYYDSAFPLIKTSKRATKASLIVCHGTTVYTSLNDIKQCLRPSM